MDISCNGRYIFGIYDFDESGVLSVDETILALRSTISGLCKLCGLDPPLESEIEAIVLMVRDVQMLREAYRARQQYNQPAFVFLP